MAEDRMDRNGERLDVESRQRPIGGPRSVFLLTSTRLGSIGLHATLEASGRYRVVGEAQPASSAALAEVRSRHPDHIIAAGDGVGGSVIEFLRTVHEASPVSTIVVYTDRFVPETVSALLAIPVRGIVSWADPSDVLIETLDVTGRGLYVITAAAVDAQPTSSSIPHLQPATYGLTATEQAVLRALGETDTQEAAAQLLAMATRTLAEHVASLKRKLDVNNLMLLGAWGYALGQVTLTEPAARLRK